jgi:hypothetical protein
MSLLVLKMDLLLKRIGVRSGKGKRSTRPFACGWFGIQTRIGGNANYKIQDHVDIRTLIYIVLRRISSKQGIAKVNG